MSSSFTDKIDQTQSFTSLLPILAFIKPYKLMVFRAISDRSGQLVAWPRC